jgi:hypothetical protein
MSIRLFEMTLDGAQRSTMHHGDLLADNRAGASPVDVSMQLSTSEEVCCFDYGSFMASDATMGTIRYRKQARRSRQLF